jgi:hypothetical protein
MAKLIHEIWREDDGTCIGLMGCLAGPMGDQARSMLSPGATLIHVYEAGSIFEADVIRNRLLDFGTYHSEWEELDSQPYPETWGEIQRNALERIPAAMITRTAKERSDVVRRIGRATTGGFETKVEALAGALDYIEPRAWTAEDRLWVHTELDRQWHGKLQQQSTWPTPTDWSRIDGVFQKLNAEGILCLHNAGYTLSQGEEDTRASWHDRGGKASSLTGFCFYHGQDVQDVVSTGTLALAYGRLTDEMADTLGTARKIVDALLAAEFQTAMPPDTETRIFVAGLVWRKHSPTD